MDELDKVLESTDNLDLIDDGFVEENEVSSKGASFFGNTNQIRYMRSFQAKLCQSNDIVKDRYNELKNELLSYKKVTARTSWHYESFRKGRPYIAKFAIRGKTLSLYLALKPEDFADTKYIFKDSGNVKKFANVPMRLKLKSNRSVRWAKELIAIMAEQNGWVRIDFEDDFFPEDKSTEELIAQNLIKVIPPKTEDDSVTTQLDEVATANDDVGGDDQTTNKLLAIVLEVSLDEDSHTSAGIQEELLEEVAQEEPQETVEEVAQEKPQETVEEVAQEEPQETVEEVAQEEPQEAVEEVVVANDEEPRFDEEPFTLPQREFEVVKEINVAQAVKSMTDEEAKKLVENKQVKCNLKNSGSKGKAIINIDTLSSNFNSGDTVNIQTLKAKKLLPNKTGSFKVLARGILNKPLIVEANDFTADAVKMILLTGGRVIFVNNK